MQRNQQLKQTMLRMAVSLKRQNTYNIHAEIMKMEIEESIQLTDESVYPNENVLKTVLGRSYSAYMDLLKLYEDRELSLEWRYYKDGKAWLCKVQHKKKTIVWMSAFRGYIQATIYIPVRILDDVLSLKIAEETKERINSTKNVGKTKPCIFDIKNKKSIRDLKTVMEFKLSVK